MGKPFKNRGQYQLEGGFLLESLFFSENDFIKALEKFAANHIKKESDAATSNQRNFNTDRSNPIPSKESSTLGQTSQGFNLKHLKFSKEAIDMLETFIYKIEYHINATKNSKKWHLAKDIRKLLGMAEQTMEGLIALKGIEREMYLGWQNLCSNLSNRIKIQEDLCDKITVNQEEIRQFENNTHQNPGKNTVITVDILVNNDPGHDSKDETHPAEAGQIESSKELENVHFKRDDGEKSKINPEDDTTEVTIGNGEDEQKDGNPLELEEEIFNNEAKEKLHSTSTQLNPDHFLSTSRSENIMRGESENIV